jgi:hypothetical protein
VCAVIIRSVAVAIPTWIITTLACTRPHCSRASIDIIVEATMFSSSKLWQYYIYFFSGNRGWTGAKDAAEDISIMTSLALIDKLKSHHSIL